MAKCADCRYLLKSMKCRLRLGTVSEGIPQNPSFNFGNACFRAKGGVGTPIGEPLVYPDVKREPSEMPEKRPAVNPLADTPDIHRMQPILRRVIK